jgi:hypothetical protein
MANKSYIIKIGSRETCNREVSLFEAQLNFAGYCMLTAPIYQLTIFCKILKAGPTLRDRLPTFISGQWP